jgi:hypothetical protein
VPAGSVEKQHDLLVGMAAGQFGQEDRHGNVVDLGKDQGVQPAIYGRDGRVGAGVFAYLSGGYTRLHAPNSDAAD